MFEIYTTENISMFPAIVTLIVIGTFSYRHVPIGIFTGFTWWCEKGKQDRKSFELQKLYRAFLDYLTYLQCCFS